MAYEIAEHNVGEQSIILAGIKDNGVIIAHIVKDLLANVFKGSVSVLEIIIDKTNPQKVVISEERNFDDAVIIITDDVTNSGRTLLYSLKLFMNAYPKKIQALVLVERSYKKFPVAPDFVGLSVSTATDEIIIVETKYGKIAGAKVEQERK